MMYDSGLIFLSSFKKWSSLFFCVVNSRYSWSLLNSATLIDRFKSQLTSIKFARIIKSNSLISSSLMTWKTERTWGDIDYESCVINSVFFSSKPVPAVAGKIFSKPVFWSFYFLIPLRPSKKKSFRFLFLFIFLTQVCHHRGGGGWQNFQKIF